MAPIDDAAVAGAEIEKELKKKKVAWPKPSHTLCISRKSENLSSAKNEWQTQPSLNFFRIQIRHVETMLWPGYQSKKEKNIFGLRKERKQSD